MKRFLKKCIICAVAAILAFPAVSMIGLKNVQAADRKESWQTGIVELQGKEKVKTKKTARDTYNSYASREEASTWDMDYDTSAGVAVGGEIYLNYESYLDNAEYTWSAEKGNVKVTGNGSQAVVSGKYTGTTKVIVKVKGTDWYGDSEIETKEIAIQVTNPKLKTTKIGTVMYYEGRIQTTGVSSAGAYRIWYDVDDSSNFNLYSDGSFYGWTKQTRKAGVYADGKYLGTVMIKITNPTWNIGYYMVKKGQTKSFAVKGASGYTPVTYKIGNKKYAAVSKTGKVKGKKYGKTTLSVYVDGVSSKIDLYIVKSKVYTAVNKAHSICKSSPKYSQAKRMKKGYVDCSSFVWKSYKKSKVYFGSKKYAPTAADIAKWCSKKKKLLKFSSYNKKSNKLKPGDLIFYKKRSGKNGRYKNIDHVAMYVGNDTIVHADGRSVSYSYPWYRKAAAIARPVK